MKTLVVVIALALSTLISGRALALTSDQSVTPIEKSKIGMLVCAEVNPTYTFCEWEPEHQDHSHLLELYLLLRTESEKEGE